MTQPGPSRAAFVGALLGALVLVGCGAEPPAQTAEPDATPGTGPETRSGEAAAVCGEVEETPDQGHHHLVGDAEPPVEYATVPPTSGWHYRQRDRIRLGVAPAAEPLSEPEQVSVLAVGGAVISHGALAEEELVALTDFVADYDDRVALTPYDELDPGQVALTAWRVRQVCSGFDSVAVAEFLEEHAGEPDFDMTPSEPQEGHVDH